MLFFTLVLSGCGGGTSGELPLEDPTNDLCSSFVSATNPPESDYQIDIILAGDSASCMPVNAKIRATVFAFDSFIADLPATDILSTVVPAQAIGERYSLRFDQSAFEAIEYQSGSTEALKYYFSIGVDLNNDGKLCNGDLRQDFERTAFTSYPASQEMVAATVYLTSVNNLPCTE